MQLQQSKYVAYALQHANWLQLNLYSPSCYGYDEMSVGWMDKCFHHDIFSILIEENKTEGFEENDLDIDIEDDDDIDTELEDFK